MNNLGDFLDKFKKAFLSSTAQKTAIIAGIKKSAGIQLDPGELEVKDQIVILKTSPVIRNEIFMRKKIIMRELENTLGKHAPGDIR
jgi:hypothetical protein